MEIIEFTQEYKTWTNAYLTKYWAGAEVVSRGNVHHAAELPGFIDLWEGNPSGLGADRIVTVIPCSVKFAPTPTLPLLGGGSDSPLPQGEGLGVRVRSAIKTKGVCVILLNLMTLGLKGVPSPAKS